MISDIHLKKSINKKPYMEELAKTLKENSERNVLKRIEKEAEKNAERVDTIIRETEKLFGKITSEYKDKLNAVSSEGYRYCVLYEYHTEEVVEKYKQSFLMNGPYNNYGKGSGLDYFKNLHIQPLRERLVEFFDPIRLDVKFNKHEKKNKVIVYW